MQKICKIGQNAWWCRIFYLLLPMSTRRERAKAQTAQQSKALDLEVVRPVDKHPIAKKMGDFFIDVAKLIIGGVILAGLMKQDIDYQFLFWLSILVVSIFITFGMYLINFANKDKR